MRICGLFLLLVGWAGLGAGHRWHWTTALGLFGAALVIADSTEKRA